jgi:hypothetical protein
VRRAVAVIVAVLAAVPGAAARSPQAPPLVRVSVQAAAGPGAHDTLLTLGGPVYCQQLRRLAATLDANLVCGDYWLDADNGAAGARTRRREDWGDPSYLAQAARALPDALRAGGLVTRRLVVVGVSYAGYADAELVATHPELHAAALVVIDSYLDLTARYDSLPVGHPTAVEMRAALGGTPQQAPDAYQQRSPSHHLDGLAAAIRGGTRLVVVWSTSPGERREFRGATCDRLADAQWLSDLSTLLGRPVDAYVTQLEHAHALWDRGRDVVALAGIGRGTRALPARRATFTPSGSPPAWSYCPG